MYLRSLKRTVQLDIIGLKMISNVAELLDYLTKGGARTEWILKLSPEVQKRPADT